MAEKNTISYQHHVAVCQYSWASPDERVQVSLMVLASAPSRPASVTHSARAAQCAWYSCIIELVTIIT